MCGVYGVIGAETVTDLDEMLDRMHEVQAHRGPDGSGRVIEQVGNRKVALGHQRLAILDLSEAGHQPMQSGSGRSLLTYNGEIYNYQELRQDHIDFDLRGESDTEVALELLERFGAVEASRLFNGMWAFASLDKENGELWFSRDRVGIKPLYYMNHGDAILFASEIKTVLAGANKRMSLNVSVIAEYLLRASQDTSTATFFEGITALPPGHCAKVDLAAASLKMELMPYWEPLKIGADLQEHGPELPEREIEDAVTQTRDLFSDSVKLHMRSDVPVGVTLSGGVDSSAIAAVMKTKLVDGQQMAVLSAVAPGDEEDESYFIDIVAKELELQVEKVTVDWEPHETIELMRKTTWYNDTPLGSLSNVAYYLLMQKAREVGVTVVLSGQGADELLCGYKKYLGFRLQSLLSARRPIKALRVLARFIMNGTVVSQFNIVEAKRYLPKFKQKNERDLRGERLRDEVPGSLRLGSGESVRERQVADLMSYSVPFLTHYEDRMSMAHSREVRLPFLDFRFIEHLLAMPVSLKLRLGWTKWVFREAVSNMLPDSITWRRDKIGFGGPQQGWLRNELRTDIEKLLNPEAEVFRQRLIDRDAWLKTYARYVGDSSEGAPVWYREVFGPLALEIWLQTFNEYIEQPDAPGNTSDSAVATS